MAITKKNIKKSSPSFQIKMRKPSALKLTVVSNKFGIRILTQQFSTNLYYIAWLPPNNLFTTLLTRDSQPEVNLTYLGVNLTYLGVNLTCLGVNFVSKKITFLRIMIGSCKSKNIKSLGVYFTFEFCQGVNERIKVENPCSRYYAVLSNVKTVTFCGRLTHALHPRVRTAPLQQIHL